MSSALELSTTTNRPSVPSLLNFVNTVPVPLTTVLVRLGPCISAIRQAVEIVSWKSSSVFDGWLALAGWWAICLLTEPGLRYFLPVAISLIFALAVNQWTSRPRQTRQTSPPVTEYSLEAVVSDLIIIDNLLPSLPSIPSTPTPNLSRILAFIYLPYLILTHLVRLRILTGIVGTILLSWRAPWASVICHSLWRSAWVRWSIYHTWSFLSGQPLPPMTLSLQPPTTTSLTPTRETRFLFTIYENQRWWVTLDWTPALLPSERPAWCSHTHGAVSPPSAFSLPEPSTILLKDEKGCRVKREATWRWEENEWKVLIKTQGDQIKRVERPQNPDNPSKSKHSKSPSNAKENVIELQGTGPKMTEHQEEAKEAMTEGSPDPTPEEPVTDVDGWVYCDNKWENPSNINGRSKFTRYRRWVRIAIVSELVEPLGPDETSIEPIASNDTASHGDLQIPSSAKKAETTADEEMNAVLIDGEASPTGDSSKKRVSLRQRMHESLRKSAISTSTTS